MTDVTRVVKITPSPKELIVEKFTTQMGLKCTEPECKYIASTSAILGLHKAKAHNIVGVSFGLTLLLVCC